MNPLKTKIALIISDYLTAFLAWTTFFYVRKVFIENVPFEFSDRFYLGVTLIPIFWITLYFILGTYQDVKRLYFVKTISITFKAVFIGTLVLFFLLILDDEIQNYNAYYSLIGSLFSLQLLFTLTPRFLITYLIVTKIHIRKWGFKTLLIGGSQKAVEVFNEVTHLKKGNGTDFIGFVNLNGIDHDLSHQLPHLGHADNLDEIIDKYAIEEVIIALDSSEREKLKRLVAHLQGKDIRTKMIPDMFDLLSGSVKMSNIFGALLIEVEKDIMPFWQFVVKRLIDITFSLIALLLLTPVYIVLAILVKRSSKGPIFFKQERIGKNGVPFNIIKFRTMYVDAEKEGPQLSSTDDPRITKIGRIMRKMRLDELPQFWNVLKGEMSLVGPRPERQYFIDKIAAHEPQFLQLTKVKPGITSWGQVKFGYAENVDEMLQRMKYDLLYLKNMSLALDFRILLHTVIIIFRASGK